MTELCTSVDSGCDLKLLPVFFMLSPADLKSPKNLKRWREAWEALAKYDNKGRIDLCKWALALQRLRAYNGVVFDPSLDEQTYIDRIVSAVSEVIPPAFEFDTTYISGVDRLSAVILDKFEKMTSGMTLGSLGKSSSTASQPKPCVLGLYGLPGSGKTTLCKCLLAHYRRIYGSKVHYLEFPPTASDADVVNKLKELVIHITNFRNRVPLDNASNIEHLQDLLKKYHISRCKVLLVVDNISESSRDAISRILHLGVGEESKIILVARTLDVLCPILDSLKNGLQWTCESLVVPSINEMEATEILLRTINLGSRVGSLESPSFDQMETIKAVVHMCSFGQLWLPLVMKAMGARLLNYEYKGGWEAWENDSEIFWDRVKTYRQDAVIKELLGDNFNSLLNKHHQLVFLDVALFFLQFNETSSKRICDSLSMMHGFSSCEIWMMIRDLERSCFLEVSAVDITVHDVYMEFAMSIRDGPSKYLDSSAISSRWEHCKVADVHEVGSKHSLLKRNDQVEGGLRTLILEVGKGYERVDLQGFSDLKAMALMNCKSMRVLGLVGLSSLAILVIRKCDKFNNIGQLDCNDASVQKIKQFCIINQADHKVRLESEQVSYWHSIVNVAKTLMMAPFRHPRSLEVGLLASRMSSLQDLHLQNTGIARLEFEGNSNLSQLRKLTIAEPHLESLRLGYLPDLTHFLFHDSGEIHDGVYKSKRSYLYSNWRSKMGNSRYELVGKDLLKGCPQLKKVSMASPFFKQGQLGLLPAGLKRFQLIAFESFELPDLSSSAHTLDRLYLAWCHKLERVNLDIAFERLTFLDLKECDTLVEVTGLGCLPNLQKLTVWDCMRLQKLIGFDNCRLLNNLDLCGCPELTEISCFNSLLNLEYLFVKDCLNLKELSMQRLCDLEKLRECRLDIVHCGECSLSLRNCKSLEILNVRQHYVDVLSGIDSPDGPVLKLEDLDNLVKLLDLSIDGGATSMEKSLSNAEARLSSLDLKALSSGCLPSLEAAEFLHLNNLRGLHGLECLTNLRRLTVAGCPLLEELPSLCALVHMKNLEVVNCPKLKAVEGCYYMEQLKSAYFDGCNSMECFPLTNPRSVIGLSFSGCKFASNNVEQMAAWATEEAKPTALRLACVEALVWEYYHPSISAGLADAAAGAALNIHVKDRIAASLWRCLGCKTEVQLHEKVARIARTLIYAEWREIESVLLEWEEIESVLLEWEEKVTKGELNFEARSLLHFLDDLRVASVLSDDRKLSWILADLQFRDRKFEGTLPTRTQYR